MTALYSLWSDTAGSIPPATLNEWFGGGAGGTIVSTSITTVGNGTLTAAALVGGQIARTGPTAAFTDTTDTASAIITALGAYDSGATFIVRYKNATAYQATLAAGTGVTMSAVTLVPPMSVGAYFGTIGGTQASPTVTFSHIDTSPLHSAAAITNPQAASISTVGAGTLTAAAINSGVILRTGSTAAFTDTSDSVTNLLAGIAAFSGGIIGSAVLFTYVNNTVAAATIAGASNVTASGSLLVPANSWAMYLLTVTSATALTMVCVAQGYFPTTGTFNLNGVTPVTVSATKVTAASAIIINLQTVGGTVGVYPHIATITPGTGFTVLGTANDTSTYQYTILG